MNNNITKNAFLIIYSFYFPLPFIVTTFFFLKKKTQQFYAMSRRSSNFLLFNRFSSCSHTSLCLCHLRLLLAFDVYMCVCYCRRKYIFPVYFLSFCGIFDRHTLQIKARKFVEKCDSKIFLTNMISFLSNCHI